MTSNIYNLLIEKTIPSKEQLASMEIWQKRLFVPVFLSKINIKEIRYPKLAVLIYKNKELFSLNSITEAITLAEVIKAAYEQGQENV